MEPHRAVLCLGRSIGGLHNRKGAEHLFSFMKISPYRVSDQSEIWNRFTPMPALVLFPPGMTRSTCNVYDMQYAAESGMLKQASSTLRVREMASFQPDYLLNFSSC